MLQELLFTIIAKDNVALHSSSNMAAGNFHGTSVAVLQFSLSTHPGKIRNIEQELLFTTIAKDNVAVHSSSNMAAGHYHGTSMQYYNFLCLHTQERQETLNMN